MWLTHSIFDKIHHIFCIATETETDKWWNTTLKYDELSLRAPTPQQHSLKLQWKWSSGACFPALHEGVTCTGHSTKGYISKSNDTETGTAKADWELLGCQLQSFRRCFPRRQRAGKEWRTSVIPATQCSVHHCYQSARNRHVSQILQILHFTILWNSANGQHSQQSLWFASGQCPDGANSSLVHLSRSATHCWDNLQEQCW